MLHREILLDDEPSMRLQSLVPDAPLAAEQPTSFLGQGFREAKVSVIASFERAYLTELLASA